ncbi:MAG TPA: glycerol kinase, partial [Phaeodactylibacter sp.]|nr:glycerol kinase [Phaeodactylibacter sp.]
MKKYILALDQGTTSSRAILFNRAGETVASAQKEFPQYYPEPGSVEHDAMEIWDSQLSVAKEVLRKAKAKAQQVAAIGITNQRETTMLWDKATGQPLYRAIVWQDRRTAAFCDKLKTAGHAKYIQEATGLVVDAYFSASKIHWLLKHVKGAR